MNNSIDQLKSEVDSIKNSLNELKNNVSLSEIEKKNKAAELKAQAEIAKKKIEDEIHSLENKTDDESKKKKEEAEILLNSFNETMKLYSSIINTGVIPPATPDKPSTGTTVKEEKGFFGKTRDWMGDQWSSVWSGDKRKEQPGTNALGVVGLGVTGYAAYKGVKALRNWAFGDKEEEEENEEKEEKKSKKKKKGFWKTGWGKALKWLGIGTAAGGGIYLFGKWLHLWGDKENPTDTDRDQVKAEAYEKFAEKPENKEAVENYEGLGENVDTMYNVLYTKELAAGYQDELAMDRISKKWLTNKSYTGIIPFCLDNKFGTVDEVMNQNTSLKNALAGGISSMISCIKGLGNEFLKTFADSYLAKLPSWAGAVGSSLSQKFDNWIASGQQAHLELEYFFRQSIRVQTYLFQKNDQLIDKIASEKSRGLGISKEDLLKDEEKREQYILNDAQYQSFLHSTIANGMNVLKNKGIFDASIGDDVKETVTKLDKERKDVVGDDIGGKDILQIVYEKEGKNLNADEKGKLGKACENIVKDVDKKIQGAVKASAWNAYGDLFASDDSALREFWGKSGLDEVFNTYKTEIIKNKAAMDRGELTEEQIKALAESVNNMLALKKEAILGRNCIQRDIDEHGNVTLRIAGFLRDSFKNLGTSMGKLVSGDFMGALNYFTSGYIGAGGVLYVMLSALSGSKNAYISIPAKFGKSAVAAPIKVPLRVVKKLTNKTNVGIRMNNSIKYGTSSWIRYSNLFNGEAGPKDLYEVFKSGDRNLNQTVNIWKAKLRQNKTSTAWRNAFGNGVTLEDFNDENLLKKNVIDTLLGDYFKSDLNSLNAIKNDEEVYNILLKNYDSSAELRKAVKSGKISEVRSAVAKVKQKIERTSAEIAYVGKPATELISNPHYKKLQSDIDGEIKSLETAKAREGSSSPKFKQIDEQIKKLKGFKNNVNHASSEEIESLENMYTTFLKVNRGKGFFDNVDTIEKLLAEQSDQLKKALNDLDEIELKRIIKELQANNKLTDITDDAITSLTKVIKEAKTSRIVRAGKKFIGMFKTLLKYLRIIKNV